MSLHEAVETGDVAAVQRLLAAGASVHERNASGETPRSPTTKLSASTERADRDSIAGKPRR